MRLSDGGGEWVEGQKKGEQRWEQDDSQTATRVGTACAACLSGVTWLSVWRVQGLLDKEVVLFLQIPGWIPDVGIYLAITVLLISLAEV